jgi:cellulose synthase operon protein C
MSSNNGLSNSPASEEQPAQIARALAWLKAEQNAAEAPSYTSVLLHESAVILESCGQDAEAAKSHRAAMSFDPDFREPLERLIALAERHHQHDDLGALYQQLAASADNTDERARACLERAFFLVERQNDANSALQLLHEITTDSPGNSVAWLLLDLVADRAGDFEARERALEAQLGLTDHPHYRGALLMEWSELREQAGDVDRAIDLLDLVISQAISTTYLALVRKERVALKAHRTSEYIRTLEQRIRLVERALVDHEAGDALGVWTQHRNETALGCLEVLASLAHAQAGNQPRAEACLANSQGHLPDDRFAKYLTWVQAERSEDWQRFLDTGEELAQLSAGACAAWLWLRLAITRWQLGDSSGARDFVTRGLDADSRSLALRAFDVHLAVRDNDVRHLASAIEATTGCFDSDTEKAEWLLAAAGIWAHLVRDASRAKAAITQAGVHGLNPSAAHQAGRLLAKWSGDEDFYDDSTRIAQHNASTPFERLDLLLELLRVRLLRRDFPRALDAVAQIAASDDTSILGSIVDATLGNCLRRQLDANSSHPGSATTEPGSAERGMLAINWERLAQHAPSIQMQRAMQVGAAVQLLVSDRIDEAQRKLDDLGDRDPSDVVVAAARVALALKQGRSQATTAILRRAAECTEDADLRATLALIGVLLGIRAVHLDDVPELLDLAGLTHPEATSAMSRWVLRRVADCDSKLARRVYDASTECGSPTRRALEQVGLSIACGSWQDPPPLPDNDPLEPATDLDVAVLLAQTIAQTGRSVPEGAPSALGAAEAALAYFDRWRGSESEPGAPASPIERLSDARDWAKSDPSLVAQLEWLLACRNANETVEEADARDHVAAHLSPKDADALRVSAHLQRFLTSAPALDLLPSTSAAARLANLEISLPGCDPRRRATAIEEAGELLGAASTPPLRACLGFNQLACGDTAKARSTFAELADAHPRFIPAWLGLRLVAETSADNALLAQSCAALGDLLSDQKEAAQQWERAATLLLDELSDSARGQRALERAVALDVTHDTAFTRLFRMVREAQQTEQLLALVAARLPHAKNQDERLMLHWERARSMRSLGDREGALLELDAVSAIDPNHVGALALAGEINIAAGRFDDAARFLAQLARQPEAPVKQRLMGGLAAADLFDKKLNRPAFAKDILLALHREGHSTEALRERLSALAIRVNAYGLAVELLEILMVERATSGARADAARLTLVLCRDHMQQPALAARAVDRLLLESPADAEGIDLILTGCFEAAASTRWLHDAEQLLRQHLVEEPMDTSGLERLANIAAWFDDIRTRQACLGALICLGAGTAEMDAELSVVDDRVAHVPAMAVDDATLQAVCDPEDCGPVAALFQDFAEVYAEALGPTLSVLGVGKKQRVDPRAGLPLRNEIVAWAGAFGIVDFDLYLTDRVVGDAIAIPGERPNLVVASSLSTPLDAQGRQAVARELFALRRGTCLLRHRSTTELTALVVASCQVGGHPLTAPAYAMLEEFVRALASAVPRRLRKTLADRADSIRTHCGSEAAIGDLLKAASCSQDRAAALAAGDVSHVLAHLTGQRGRPASTNELRERMARLLSFALSPQYLDLKDKLGLLVR